MTSKKEFLEFKKEYRELESKFEALESELEECKSKVSVLQEDVTKLMTAVGTTRSVTGVIAKYEIPADNEDLEFLNSEEFQKMWMYYIDLDCYSEEKKKREVNNTRVTARRCCEENCTNQTRFCCILCSQGVSTKSDVKVYCKASGHNIKHWKSEHKGAEDTARSDKSKKRKERSKNNLQSTLVGSDEVIGSSRRARKRHE
jgi:hypothetical protein